VLGRLPVELGSGGELQQPLGGIVDLSPAEGQVRGDRGHHDHDRVLVLRVDGSLGLRDLELDVPLRRHGLVAVLEAPQQIPGAVVGGGRVDDLRRPVHHVGQ
jgi:hypothetical protein